jgi:acetolactate synthase-1/2/3 large subunit
MPLWYIGATLQCQATRRMHCGRSAKPRRPATPQGRQRRKNLAMANAEWQRGVTEREQPRGELTAEYLVACIREAIGEDAIVVSEAVTNFHVVSQHMRRTKAGTLFSSGGGSLGYNGGAAFGIKLARPDALVVAICGDGSYLFSQPSTVHWLARAYQAPFLHVVLNTTAAGARRARPCSACVRRASRRSAEDRHRFSAAADYAAIAAAAGALIRRPCAASRREAGLERALKAIPRRTTFGRHRRARVVNPAATPGS